MKCVFEEYSARVHEVSEGYVCAMKEEYVVPLVQRVKKHYVVHSIDRVDVVEEDGIDCVVKFTGADPDDDNGSWWKSSPNKDEWTEDYGDDLYYK